MPRLVGAFALAALASPLFFAFWPIASIPLPLREGALAPHIDAIDPEDMIDVSASQPALETGDLAVEPDRRPTLASRALTGTIEGRAFGPDDKLVPGRAILGTADERSKLVHSNGEFRFEELDRSKTYYVSFDRGGCHGPWSTTTVRKLEVGADVTIRLPRRDAEIRGQVLLEDGTPARVMVWATWRDGQGSHMQNDHTDRKGRFRLDVPTGRCRLYAGPRFGGRFVRAEVDAPATDVEMQFKKP